ncbi:hypothetical protein bcgnr5378_07350 [Bacillus cereus]|uniref:Lipoprotein n=1 Tax=Bacillus cereus TaxID=1396 RepID=A0A164NY38_BACCE|nr:hypothetical protein [Bacillus cereus]KZD65985.1 hypothetical protein B4088_2742 [Bacillus cereus]
MKKIIVLSMFLLSLMGCSASNTENFSKDKYYEGKILSVHVATKNDNPVNYATVNVQGQLYTSSLEGLHIGEIENEQELIGKTVILKKLVYYFEAVELKKS